MHEKLKAFLKIINKYKEKNIYIFILRTRMNLLKEDNRDLINNWRNKNIISLYFVLKANNLY